MRSTLLLLSVLALAACSANRRTDWVSRCKEPVIELQAIPTLGQQLALPGETCVHTMAASAQTWPSYATVIDGIRFTLGVDGDARVRFVFTNDPAFVPPEGIRIGDSAAKALAAAPGESVRLEPGWGNYVRLPSGWNAFIDDRRVDAHGRFGMNLGTAPVGPNARVSMFFLRD